MSSYGKSDFKVIRVTPTLSTDAYADHDVFFATTEIPNAVLGLGGTSKLIGITILNEDDVAQNLDIVFMQVDKDLGTINASVGSGSLWTNALAKAAKVLGIVKVKWTDNTVDLINNLVHTTRAGDASTNGEGFPMLLQAEGDSTSVYFAAVSRSGTPTTAADDYEFIFHIEYN